MKIVLSGIETNNKGAELMLYAILQEIERQYPNAEVYVPIFAIKQGFNYIQTPIRLKDKPLACAIRLLYKLKIYSIFYRLHLPTFWLQDIYPVHNADYFIDASGFAFSDQWKPTAETVKRWEYLLSKYKQQGTKIFFLPQAFGPAEMPNTQKEFSILNKYADIIMPREQVSYDYLINAKVNKNKIVKFTDFTSLVKGKFPKQYEHLRNGICIIPNMRMIDKGVISFNNYVELLADIIKISSNNGHPVYLLNHEGICDEKLAYMCKDRLDLPVEVVSGLNALEVKGLIASAYLCISSRFHGVASALNSCVPCLATSWSHKYAELFKDYKMEGCVLDLTNRDLSMTKIMEYLQVDKNKEIRSDLISVIPHIQNETKKMWEYIWG